MIVEFKEFLFECPQSIGDCRAPDEAEVVDRQHSL
jgi:hypothetical protein